MLALLSGGNIDASLMVQVMRHGLALAGRYLVLRTRVLDRPGELAKLLDLLAGERVNVVEVEHQREAAGVPVGYTGVELTLLTRDPGARASSCSRRCGSGATPSSGSIEEIRSP